MKFDKNIKLEMLMSVPDSPVATDPRRNMGWTTTVWLDKGHLVASDGKVLAAVRVETEPTDVDGIVPLEAIETARKVADRTTASQLHILLPAADRAEVPGSDIAYFHRGSGTLPDWRHLIVEKNELKLEHNCVIRCAFNPTLLALLVEAAGRTDHFCVLTFRVKANGDGSCTPMFVTIDGKAGPLEDMQLVLMPTDTLTKKPEWSTQRPHSRIECPHCVLAALESP